MSPHSTCGASIVCVCELVLRLCSYKFEGRYQGNSTVAVFLGFALVAIRQSTKDMAIPVCTFKLDGTIHKYTSL